MSVKKNLKISTVFRVVFLFSCLAIVFSFAGCFGRVMDPNALYRLDREDLFSVAMSSFIPVSPDGEWDEIREIESDKYGRILFVYYMSNNNSSAYGSHCWAFVCHDSDEKYVYFYDDCFIKLEGNEPTKDELNKLKNMNDWNMPIKEDKLSKTHMTDEYVRYDSKNEPIICDLFETDNIEAVYSICTDKNGLSLYLYLEIVKTAEGKYKTLKEYIVLKDLNGKFIYEEIHTDKDYLKQITNFKQANNWDSREYTIIFNRNAS